jgi:hypothetical protein
MNNRAADHSLPEGTARNIVNADVDAAGRLRRRAGLTKVYPGVDVRDGYSCPAGEFFVESNNLMQLIADNSATRLQHGIVGPLAYHYMLGRVYMSDSRRTYKLINGSIHTWGLPRPPKPTLSGAVGSLPPGVYAAAIVGVDGDGLESGASEIATINLRQAGGIVFTNLPVLAGQTVRLYLGTANGTELYHVADTAAASYTVAAQGYDDGATLETRGVSRPPVGRIIRDYKGRVYIADGAGLVWYSDVFRYDHFRLDEGYLMFPGPAALMEPVKDGIFFATDNATWFYAGTPEEGFEIIPVFDYGAVFGTSVRRDDGSVMWQSQRGAVKGAPDGSARNEQEKHVAPDHATAGAAIIREENGMQQFIASLRGTRTNTLAASSWIDAEVIRRGA